MKRPRILSMLAGFALVLAACGTASSNANDETESPNAEGLTVVVTTTVWGDIVSEVTGDSATVEVLYPVGADPHDYQLSSSQVASMQKADLVVVNGLQLEVGILDVIESLEADGANVFEVAPLLDPIAFGAGGGECEVAAGHDHDEEGDHDEEEGSCDPHIWMDPLRVATAAELIAGELAALDPSVDWTAKTMAYADELRTLDEEVIAMLETVPDDRRKMVTNHEAFGYFVDRYGFEVVGVVIPGGSTLADPSSAELAELVEIMTEENINVIFGETVDPSALGDAVAAEVGTDVVVVELFTGSLGSPGSGAETYVDMIRTNAVLISEALS